MDKLTERLLDARSALESQVHELKGQNCELREALENMTGLFGEAVTRHQMGKAYSELHQEAVKSAKDALAKYAEKQPSEVSEVQALRLQNEQYRLALKEIYQREGPGLDGSSENASGRAARLALEGGIQKRKCGLSKPMGVGETCTLEVGHRGPCDYTQNRKCEKEREDGSPCEGFVPCPRHFREILDLGDGLDKRNDEPEPRHCVKCGARVEKGDASHPYTCVGTGNAANPAPFHECVGVRFCAVCNVRV